MFLLLNEEQAKKKKFARCFKVIVSADIKKPIDERSVILEQYIPPVSLFADFINGTLNKKEFYKKYVGLIKEDEARFSTLLTLMLSCKTNRMLCLVCSQEEMGYFYLGFLAKFMMNRYGVPYMNYKEFKEKIDDVSAVKFILTDEGKEKFDSDIKKYRSIIFNVDYDDDDKKSKKKKKDKDKKKDKKDKKNKKDKKAAKVDYDKLYQSEIAPYVKQKKKPGRKKKETVRKIMIRRL